MHTPGGYWMVIAQDGSAPPKQPKPGAASAAVLWVGVLMVAALAGGILWLWLRRQLFAADAATAPGSIMEDLRRMRDQGQITQEEYDTVRKRMVAKLAKSGFGDAKAPPGGPGRPSKGPRADN